MTDNLPAVAMTGTAIERMAADVLSLAAASKSKNTILAYRKAWSGFTSWGNAQGVSTLPASPEVVAAYLTVRMQAGLKASSLSVHSSAIRHFHKQADFPSPTEHQGVIDVQRGIRRTIGTAQVQKSPATAERMAAMLAHTPKTLRGVRDRAILLLGFAGALRRSEIADIDLAHMTFTEHGMDLVLPFSKTDQEGEGQTVAIPHGQSLMPVKAVKAWIEASGVTEGALFRPINKAGKVSAERLTDRSIAETVKTYAAAAGLPVEEFSGHSMRAGFVTSASERGADINRIMDQTRHTDPRTVRKYIRRADRYRGHAGAGFL